MMSEPFRSPKVNMMNKSRRLKNQITLLFLLAFNLGILSAQHTVFPDLIIWGEDQLPEQSDTSIIFDLSNGGVSGGARFISGFTPWDRDSIGSSSFAYGENVIASGVASVAFGRFSVARGFNSTAIGSNTVARGSNGATALGRSTEASGNDGATALGYFTRAHANSGTALGQNNDPLVAIGYNGSDKPLFIVGNGTSFLNRSNVMVVRQDGSVGIGSDATMGQVSIKQRSSTNDEGLRIIAASDNTSWEIRHTSSGDNLRFRAFADDGSTDHTVEIRRSDGAYLQNSDVRLKKDIRPMTHQFDNILSLTPSIYRWKDHGDQSRPSIGLIAQEVEVLFPSLVHTNEDGYKMVNYDGLGVLAIQAIKEQQEKLESQTQIERSAIKELIKENALLKKESAELRLENQRLDQKYNSLEARISNIENKGASSNSSE